MKIQTKIGNLFRMYFLVFWLSSAVLFSPQYNRTRTCRSVSEGVVQLCLGIYYSLCTLSIYAFCDGHMVQAIDGPLPSSGVHHQR